MYERNSNRRRFNFFGNNENTNSHKLNNLNYLNNKTYAEKSHISPEKLSNKSLVNGKSYSYMKIKSSSMENDKNLKMQERFLYVILTVSIITAIVCGCLSIASMIMFFSI